MFKASLGCLMKAPKQAEVKKMPEEEEWEEEEEEEWEEEEW